MTNDLPKSKVIYTRRGDPGELLVAVWSPPTARNRFNGTRRAPVIYVRRYVAPDSSAQARYARVFPSVLKDNPEFSAEVKKRADELLLQHPNLPFKLRKGAKRDPKMSVPSQPQLVATCKTRDEAIRTINAYFARRTVRRANRSKWLAARTGQYVTLTPEQYDSVCTVARRLFAEVTGRPPTDEEKVPEFFSGYKSALHFLDTMYNTTGNISVLIIRSDAPVLGLSSMFARAPLQVYSWARAKTLTGSVKAGSFPRGNGVVFYPPRGFYRTGVTEATEDVICSWCDYRIEAGMPVGEKIPKEDQPDDQSHGICHPCRAKLL